jgi:hypothetical protein
LEFLRFPNRPPDPLPSLLPRARVPLLFFLPPAVLRPWPPLCHRHHATSCWINFHVSSSPCPSPLPSPRCPRLCAPRLPGALLGRHLAVTVESSLQHAKALSFARNSTTKAPTFCSLGSSANSRTPAAISNAASSSSTPATPAHRGQPRSTAHCSHQSPNQLSRPLLVLPSHQSPSNFNQSTLADARRLPPPPAHRGQLTPSLPAPPQPLSQHYINPVKLYDPFVGSLVHCIAFPTLAGVYLCRHRHCLHRLPLIRSVCSQFTALIPFPQLTGACVQVLRRCWPPEHRRHR